MRTLIFVLSALFATGVVAQAKPPEKKEGSAKPAAQQKVRVAGVRLLSSQADFEASVTAKELAAYVGRMEKSAAGIFASSKSSGMLVIEVNSSPKGENIKLGSDGGMDEELMQKFYDSIIKMERLPVRNKAVAFQVQISVGP